MSELAAASAGGGRPLAGVRVLEFGDSGPAPFAAMLLAELGADCLRIERPDAQRGGPEWITLRGRPAIALDLKDGADRAIAGKLAARADILMEGYRPGVMERLGLGPAELRTGNPCLVYCRATGWGQDGPWAQAPGHDLNYLAITGILGALGEPDEPSPVPLNIIGDFGGGAMMLAFGALAALREAERSGQGQVLDCAMSEGASSLASFLHYMCAAGRWTNERQANLLDGGAPFYAVYACADGGFVAVGAIEPKFFAELLNLCGLATDPSCADQHDRARWPTMRQALAAGSLKRTRDGWAADPAASGACVTPVLGWDEASAHPQNAARGAFLEHDGVLQPAPALRLSRTTAHIDWATRGRPRDAVLRDWVGGED